MMKKTLALLMVMAMVFCGCAALAEAAQDETVVYNFEDVKGYLSSPDHQGNFVEYEDLGFQFWVPSPMEQGGMTQEMVDGSCIDFFLAPEMPQYNIVVRHTEYDGLVSDFDDLVAVAPHVYEDFRLATINGRDALVAHQNSGDAMVVVIPDVQGRFLEINYNGCSDEDFIPDAGISIASIQFED